MGLLDAAKGVLLGVGDVLKEAGDVGGLEVARVALVVKEDEPVGPVGVALGGAVLAEPGEGDLADEVEQARGLGRGGGGERLCGHGLLPSEKV